MNKIIKNKILSLVKKDQKMRKSSTSKWNFKVDKENTNELKKVIKKYGWPDFDLVGKEASKGAWLIAQHADHDVKFQEYCLNLMKEKLKDNKIEPQYFAYLTDRVLVNQDKPQLYGTQFYLKNNKLIPRPIKDTKNLEKRRKKFELEPFTKYRARLLRRQKLLKEKR
jgi:hypothetical protein